MRKDLALEEALPSVVEMRQKKSVVSNYKKSAKITLMEAEKWKPEESPALALKETGISERIDYRTFRTSKR